MKKIKTLFMSFTPFLVGYGIQFAAVFYCVFLAVLIMYILSPALTGTFPGEQAINELMMDVNFNAFISIVFAVCCIAIFAIWYYRSYGGELRPNLRRHFHPLKAVAIVIMVPGAQFACSFLISILSTIFPKWLEEYNAMMEAAGMTDTVPVLMMIYSVCLAPLSEELIFRGVTMRIAQKAFPFWAANLIQAVLFGVFHMNMLQGCYAFAFGLILGYVCHYGGTIYYAIFFHFLFNLWGTTSQWLNELSPELVSVLVLAGTCFVLPAGALLFYHGTRKKISPM